MVIKVKAGRSLRNCRIETFALRQFFFFLIASGNPARNNSPLVSESLGMMPNFCRGRKVFHTHDFQGVRCGRPLLSQAILQAPNPKCKTPGAGLRVNVERRGQQGEQYLDATTGDIPSNQDSRASLRARLCPCVKLNESSNGRGTVQCQLPAKAKTPSEESPATRTGLASHWRLVPTVHIEPWRWP